MDKFLKKILPRSAVDKIAAAMLFRAEDPNKLHQILPQRVNPTEVQRIQGFRYPSPGSRVVARVPITDEEDHVYNSNYYIRDPRNLLKNEDTLINSKQTVMYAAEEPHMVSHGKRQIAHLLYDDSGLRTTKTATWTALDKALATNALPNHLPEAEWETDSASIEAERQKKDIPGAVGRRYKMKMSENYTEVRW